MHHMGALNSILARINIHLNTLDTIKITRLFWVVKGLVRLATVLH